jgi:hypothetical protein
LLQLNSIIFKFFYREFHLTQKAFVSKDFEEAKAKLNTLQEDPGSDIKLKIYALFKQVKGFFDSI